MFKIKQTCLLATAFATTLFAGCESMPGTRKQQGAAIGGATGAAAGAAVAGSDDRLLGAIIGGVIGAGGGYVIAANTGAVEEEDRQAVAEAANEARQNPATPEEARQAQTADVNADGFVTMDEIVALSDAGLSDEQMGERLEATNQLFDLTDQQQADLVSEGVSLVFLQEMQTLNRDNLYGSPKDRNDVISRDRDTTP